MIENSVGSFPRAKSIALADAMWGTNLPARRWSMSERAHGLWPCEEVRHRFG